MNKIGYESKLEKGLKYLLALVVILQGTSQLVFMIDGMWFILAFGVIAAVLICLNLKADPIHKIYKIIKIIMPIIVIHSIYIVCSKSNIISCVLTFTLPILIWITYGITVEKAPFEFLNQYSNIIVVLSCISIFFWLFGQQFRLIPYRNVTTEWMENPVQTYGFVHFVSQSWLRNTGIFTESPMYVYHLSIALVWKLWKKQQKGAAAILVTTLLTTFSATGIIVGTTIVIWFILYRLYRLFRKEKRRDIFFKGVAFILLWGVICGGTLWFKKADFTDSKSFETRQEHIEEDIKLAIEKPLVGKGYNTIIASSNSWFLMFAEQGILMIGLFWLAMGLCAKRAISVRRLDLIMLTGTFWIIMFAISMINREITYYMFASFWCYGTENIIGSKKFDSNYFSTEEKI